ncbi:hypothetical protein Rsub_04958 [Raphidocelis subcapitata]|uniref:Nucleotide-diphospho-sugar transferase domain-containing protein n=1 Tax=Raphidocelis subcapitata TaxID=307507 RepID=A0A2V0P1Y8_9CHLO|nr:hypothetical protein Rsub_04958 [Raphidocelis subcapitata]|eukprot:GBF91853.1 hypothetical protein Rsub_04958 [Raphidocelis subcapitata]
MGRGMAPAASGGAELLVERLGRVGLASKVGARASNSSHVGADLLPWDIRSADKLPWEGLQEDLDALLRVQARDNAVSILVFNEGFYHVTLNCLVSAVKVAKLDNLVIVAAGARSAARCRQLRLPCLDAARLTREYGGAAAEGDAARGSAEWFQLVWVKTLAAHAAIARGYDVAFVDADTVFLKEAMPVYRDFLSRNNADGTFMYEEANQTRDDGAPYLNRYLNSGNFFLRSNARTRRLMDAWLLGYRFQSQTNGNQLWLNKLEGLAYKLCLSPAACARRAAEGWAAIHPHPNQFDGAGQMCTPDSLAHFRGGLCTDRRLYVHAVCRAGQHLKRRAFERLGLWLVAVNPDDDLDVRAALPPALPCGGGTWRQDYSRPSFA